MPKKPPRNAFYFYMLDFKEEQRKKGVNYKNMAEVADAAGPLWRDAPPPVRTKFDTMAKQERLRNGGSENKFTSTGISLADLERQEKEKRDLEEFEKKDIKNIVKLKSFNNSIITEDFYLMDVNWFCIVQSSKYIIAEYTLLHFNLQDGIIDHCHELINPGSLPLGYASDAKLACKELGFEMPDEERPRSNYIQILAKIIAYLKRNNRESSTLPPIFTMPDKVEPVFDFIHQMCVKSASNENLFRVYKLDYLFFTLMNSIKSQRNEGLPKESLALMQLKKDTFKYNPGLGCERHETEDKAVECTLSRARRWAYTLFDHCCPVAGLDLRPGTHLPRDFDLDSILDYKDSKTERRMPTIAGVRQALSALGDSSIDDSFNHSVVSELGLNSSASTSVQEVKKDKRVHVPMRMPKMDYSLSIRQAPELSESNFPSLSAGRGRGRSLASSFDRMNIKK